MHIQCGKYNGRIRYELPRCRAVKDQKDHVLSVREELGDKQLFLN